MYDRRVVDHLLDRRRRTGQEDGAERRGIVTGLLGVLVVDVEFRRCAVIPRMARFRACYAIVMA